MELVMICQLTGNWLDNKSEVPIFLSSYFLIYKSCFIISVQNQNNVAAAIDNRIIDPL